MMQDSDVNDDLHMGLSDAEVKNLVSRAIARSYDIAPTGAGIRLNREGKCLPAIVVFYLCDMLIMDECRLSPALIHDS